MSQSVSNSIGLSSPKIYTPVDFGSSVMPPLSPHYRGNYMKVIESVLYEDI
jgi:hypothetical protein